MLLAIDPGNDAGWSLFDPAGRLVRCGLVDSPHKLNLPAGTVIDRVVIERPMIYPGGRQKARPRDIITLAVHAGEWSGRFGTAGVLVTFVEPAEWKGGPIPKDVSHARIIRKLDEGEQAVVLAAKRANGKAVTAKQSKDVLDSVGIGLFAVGR